MMASPGNPHQPPPLQQPPSPQPPFDMHSFFNTTNPNSSHIPNHSNLLFPPSSSSSYPPPTAFSASPFHTHFLPSYNHHQFPIHLQQPHQQQHHRSLSFPIPPLQPQPISSPSNPNVGARLMALLSAPPQPSSPVVTNLPPIAIITAANAATAALNQVQSSKVPKGRHLTGDHILRNGDPMIVLLDIAWQKGKKKTKL
ncbi:hypothetical protein Lal_00017019 [Lupinus albus]|nr:hypothetical protein Lal_00017019 [Lupinus albus]